MASLNFLLSVLHHVVTKIVKSHLVVCAVCNIAVVSLLALCVALFMNDKTYAQAEETIKLAHPLGVTLCKIIVDCYDMNALAGKCVKISRKGSNKCFTFTGFHLGDSALMKNYTTDKLNIKVTHTEHTVGSLTANSKSFGKNVIKSFAL